jgi:hypothetical protein
MTLSVVREASKKQEPPKPKPKPKLKPQSPKI